MSIIILGGLVAGITNGILVLLYVKYELIFDNFNKNANDIEISLLFSNIFELSKGITE
jgi:hypothetical protein